MQNVNVGQMVNVYESNKLVASGKVVKVETLRSGNVCYHIDLQNGCGWWGPMLVLNNEYTLKTI